MLQQLSSKSTSASATGLLLSLLLLFCGPVAQAQEEPNPYDCCLDRECLQCPSEGISATLAECGEKGYHYGFDITSGVFVCEPTGIEETCCDTVSADPCTPNPGETCWSWHQYCWEAFIAVPCLADETQCCDVDGNPVGTTFMEACAADATVNDFCPMRATLTIAGPDGPIDEDAGVMEFTVTLSNPPLSEVVSVSVQTTDGTAIAGADYSSINTQLTFSPGGSLTQQVSVPILNDLITEGDETFEVALVNERPSFVIVEQRMAIGTIKDDDVPILSIADAAPVTEGAGPMMFEITLSQAPLVDVTVDVQTTAGGTATPGTDFNPINTRLVLPPSGSLTQQVSVDILDDNIHEIPEIIEVTLANEGPVSSVSVGRRTATGSILDNDAPANLMPQITYPTSGQTIQVYDNDVLSIDVESTDDNDIEGSGLSYSLVDGADISHFDIDETTGIITFVGGTTPPYESPMDENEDNIYQLVVRVQDSGGLTSYFVPFSVQVLSPPSLSIAPVASAVDEDAGTMDFIVTLINPPASEDVSVTVQTSDGTAIDGGDYQGINTQLTFSPGASLTQQVSVTIIDDLLSEVDETFEVYLVNEQPSSVMVEQRTAMGVIRDNDGPTNQMPQITYPTSGQTIQIYDTQVLSIDVQSTDDNDSEGSGLSYSLVDGDDISLFDIDETTGVITFVGGITPPYESPTDQDGDNIYQLVVRVQDSGGLTSYFVPFTVQVLDGESKGGAMNDPHFLTWNGKMYDYMGACDLVLVHAPNFANNNTMLDIHIRTKIRFDYSYIETAAIRIGEDILEVGSFGEIFLNGVAGDRHNHHLGYLANFPITHTIQNKKVVLVEIQITKREKIKIKTFKDWVSVTIDNADMNRFVGSSGMMGEFGTGKLLGRDGKTVIEDPPEFGAEWQVRDDEAMLFQSVNGPQFPETCQLPDPSMAEERRRLLSNDLSLEAAQLACATWGVASREGCIHDVLATGDLDLAAAGSF